ncbi:MAG: SRPBCC family protein [Fimbriimonadaceae bacterium]|jgi:hypothetical protein|nr:SRPBCC family protein [Fimbriimonadaceae bacterium]
MFTRVYETTVEAPVEKVWELHSRVDALKVLTPPDTQLHVVSKDLSVRDGVLHEMVFKKMGMKMTWKARISDVRAPYGFTDTAERAPFAYWQHKHEFIPSENGTIVRDTITYKPLGWFLAGLVNEVLIKEDLDKLFAYRQRTMHELLESEPVVINEDLIH